MLYSLRVEDFLQPTSGWRSSQTTNCERKTYFENNGNYGEGGSGGGGGGWRSIDLGDDLSTRVTGEKTARQGREENVGEKEKIWWYDGRHVMIIIWRPSYYHNLAMDSQVDWLSENIWIYGLLDLNHRIQEKMCDVTPLTEEGRTEEESGTLRNFLIMNLHIWWTDIFYTYFGYLVQFCIGLMWRCNILCSMYRSSLKKKS